jgi:hypothetical protein
MTKPKQSKKSKAVPLARQRIKDSALVWPEHIAEKLPNELELAQLVVAHLPCVTGYHTLPAQANGALHEVLEVLAAIRRWKKDYRWPAESLDEFQQIQMTSSVKLEIESDFKRLAGGRAKLDTEAFLKAVWGEQNGTGKVVLLVEGWKGFCKEKDINTEVNEWTCEQAKMYGPDFRDWFSQKRGAIAKRQQRERKRAAAMKGVATKKANEEKVGTAKSLSARDARSIDEAAAKHSSPAFRKSRQKFGKSV